MVQMSIGDLSGSFWNQINNRRLKMSLETLSQELTTGKTTDLKAATGGDLKTLTSLENTLTNLNAYKITAAETAIFAETAQRALTNVQDITSELGSSLLLAASSESDSVIQATTSDAAASFSTIVSALNIQVGNRAVFAGTATNGNALASSDEILSSLQTAVSAETTATGIEAAVNSWFDDVGGGFESTGYQGSTADLAPFRIGPNEVTSMTVRADDQGIKDLLKGYAFAALISEGTLSNDLTARAELTKITADRFLASENALTELRASVGSVEAQVDAARARNGAEVSALEIARTEIIGVDPYKAATELQTAQSQMEMLYTMTARLSRLSLADYI